MIPRQLFASGLAVVLLLDVAVVLAQDDSPTQDDRLVHMVLVPAGEFRMGSLEDDSFSEGDEKPQRVIYLPDFYIDKLEVSNIEYKRFTDATGYAPPEQWRDGVYVTGADFYPVIEISWWEAMAYARWIGKRLPTETEWEKAACGVDARRFPWGDEFDIELANSSNDYDPVASNFKGEGPYGALNMSGNVAEWTATAYAPYPEIALLLPDAFGGRAVTSNSGSANAFRDIEEGELVRARTYVDKDDPLLQFFTIAELADGRKRVYRGGSLNNYTQFLRCANRQKANPNSRWYNIGFRCAMDPPQSQTD